MQQTLSFAKVDDAISGYYTAMNQDDYYNADGIGKFAKFAATEEIDEEENSVFTEFDNHFPLNPSLRNANGIQQMLYIVSIWRTIKKNPNIAWNLNNETQRNLAVTSETEKVINILSIYHNFKEYKQYKQYINFETIINQIEPKFLVEADHVFKKVTNGYTQTSTMAGTCPYTNNKKCKYITFIYNVNNNNIDPKEFYSTECERIHCNLYHHYKEYAPKISHCTYIP